MALFQDGFLLGWQAMENASAGVTIQALFVVVGVPCVIAWLVKKVS